MLLESTGSEGAMVPWDQAGRSLHTFQQHEFFGMVSRIHTLGSTGRADTKEINPESENQTLLMHHGGSGGAFC